jgi:hypothetical protein
MFIRALRVALLIALGGTFGLQHAHADIYTWVDASGSINVSNLAPPDGVRVTSIMRASAPVATGDETARDAARQAKTQALEDRVRQLENEVELARREVPPPVEYRPIPAPPVVQYIVEPPPVFVQYAISAPPPVNNWCDASLNCAFAWAPAFYPVSVVVLRAPTFQHFRPAPGVHNFGTHSSLRTPLVSPLSTPLVPPLATPIVRPLLPPPLRPPESFRRG